MSHDKPDHLPRSSPDLGALLEPVLALSPEDRDRWLDESSGGDRKLREQLSDLIRQAQTAQIAAMHLQPRVSSGPKAESGGEPEEYSPLTGRRLGRYEVLDLLGAGGMGAVYRAVDASLGREVAIKAVARAFRGDPASLRRFEREARVLATLNHPNIATIYGFEELDGSQYLILERVEGETLAQRLARGRLPVEDALAVALQIIAGLEEAHGKGVIHRDLKPSNVMLMPGGRVKLVDFGLAKTAGPRPPTHVAPETITAVGVVLGTSRYMSPEQLMGEDVDARTDVWAFGCVLYEMLTAEPAFKGRSETEIAAAVLRDEPHWDALPADTPRNVSRLLRRCLRRDAHNRLHHIADARLDLADVEVEADRPASGGARSKWALALLLAITAVISAGALYLMRSPPAGSAARPAQLSLELPPHMLLGSEYSAPFAIARTGSTVAIEAVEGDTRRLYIRSLDNPSLRALAGSEGARQPFFSADGAWVAFFANRKLSKMPTAGGPMLQLADIGDNPRGAAWLPDGTIVVAPTQTSGLVRVPERGGKPVPLTTLDPSRGEYSHRWPDVLPDGKWVLFTVGLEDATFDEARIEAVSVETGERRAVIAGAGFARYMADGRLLFVRGGQLHAVEFDPERVVVRGTPEIVLDAVRYDPRNGGTHLAVSAADVLIYGPGEPISSEHYLSWVDRSGQLRRTADIPRRFRDIRSSPDGQRAAIVIGPTTESDLWLMEANGTLSRLSFALAPHRPTWTPDGVAITVGAPTNRTWRLLTIAADGKADPLVLFESQNRLYPNAWSADGRRLIFQESRPDTGWDLWVLEVDASGRPVGAPQAFATTPFHESSAAISHDGRWIAYESDEVDGVVQIYVRSFPEGGAKVRATTGGARWPAWDSTGNLYSWQTGENVLHAAHTRESDGQLIIDAPAPVWADAAAARVLSRAVISVAGARYDVDRSGTRFLVLERAASESRGSLSQPLIVLGWRNARSGD
ncbi:MAG: protein kinase domain-containing protein [Steroidobacter sp.]